MFKVLVNDSQFEPHPVCTAGLLLGFVCFHTNKIQTANSCYTRFRDFLSHKNLLKNWVKDFLDQALIQGQNQDQMFIDAIGKASFISSQLLLTISLAGQTIWICKYWNLSINEELNLSKKSPKKTLKFSNIADFFLFSDGKLAPGSLMSKIYTYAKHSKLQPQSSKTNMKILLLISFLFMMLR